MNRNLRVFDKESLRMSDVDVIKWSDEHQALEFVTYNSGSIVYDADSRSKYELLNCTDLRDIESNILYEGDVVEVYYGDEDRRSYVGHIVHCDGEHIINVDGYLKDSLKSIVSDNTFAITKIGNIYTDDNITKTKINLNNLLERRHISQERLAKRIKVPLNELEGFLNSSNNLLDVRLLSKIAATLNITDISEILSLDNVYTVK